MISKREKELATKYPRLIAHMIAQSLGYYPVSRAVAALDHYIRKEPHFCEWHCHIADSYDREKVLEVTLSIPRVSFQNRHYHKGMMSSYQTALKMVNIYAEKGIENEFAAWF